MEKNTRYRTKIIQPKILYYGTAVILLTTLNEDGTTNISPLSSSWALGDQIVMGLGCDGKALENLQRKPECVINIPNPKLWVNIENIAALTGKDPVPEYRKLQGFQFSKNKFKIGEFSSIPSEMVTPSRIMECPLQVEAKVENIYMTGDGPDFAIVTVKTARVHAHETIVINQNYIDPQKWSPLIYNFRHYFGLGAQLGKSYRSET